MNRRTFFHKLCLVGLAIPTGLKLLAKEPSKPLGCVGYWDVVSIDDLDTSPESAAQFVRDNPARSGCSLTRATITPLTPDEFAALLERETTL